jgi:hypothetical protein
MDRRTWRKVSKSTDIVYVLEAQEVGLFAQRYRVDQPRTQTEGQGNSGDGLHHELVRHPHVGSKCREAMRGHVGATSTFPSGELPAYPTPHRSPPRASSFSSAFPAVRRDARRLYPLL